MKLYYTPTSPYARLVRIVIIEKGLESRVALEVAQTRVADSPYYRINPTGRVPYLVRDDGVGMEDSALVCSFLDTLDGSPRLTPALDTGNWEYGRIETTARSLTDGVSVWGREMRRPENERSPTILAHEAARARRIAAMLDGLAGSPHLNGHLNMAQMLLIAGLDFAAYSGMGRLDDGHPRLSALAARLRALPSIARTAPDRPV